MNKEEIGRFYSKYKLYLFPTIVALSSLFLILFVIYPQIMKLLDNQKATDELIRKTKILETKVTALESINGEDISRKVKLALNVYPAEKDFGSTFSLLQQVIAQSGFSINSISLGNSSGKSGNSDSFQISLEVKGPKALFQTLLSNLENSPRLVKINSIDGSLNQTSQALAASLAVEVLYSAAPKNFGAVDSPLPEISQVDEQLIANITKVGGASIFISTMSASPRGKANPFE